MKISFQLIISFSIIILVTSISLSTLIMGIVVESAISQDILQMKSEIAERVVLINNLHDRSSKDLVFTLKNPKFVEYFELPETRAGNVFENNVLQFTDNQREIKQELETMDISFSK